MKFVTAALIAIIVLLQYPLWLGKGSWLRVWEVDRQVKVQKETNQKFVTRNAALDAEVRDLKQGLEAIEERARFELGMVKQDEVFFQIINNDRAVPLALSTELAKVPPPVASPGPAATPPPSTAKP